ARREPVHALRRRPQGQPPVVRRSGAAGGRRAALRALPRAPRRARRRVRRAHGRRARQRRARHPAAGAIACGAYMAPEPRFVIRFAAEPPQEGLPYGRWAEQLQAEFLAACLRVDTEGEEIGEPGEVRWFPDRTYGGRTYVPATTPTSAGFELYGHVSFGRDEDGEPTDFAASADFTGETAEANPDWQIDLCDEV